MNCELGRYLTGWMRHDSAGWNHQMAVLSCALAMAAISNRTLVLPNLLRFPRGHTFSKVDETYPFNATVDINLMSRYNGTSIILNDEFHKRMNTLNNISRRHYIPGILKRADFKNCDHIRSLQKKTCVYTHRSQVHYMFNYCQKSTNEYPKCLYQPADYIKPIKDIANLVQLISESIKPFIHIHVRRGDRGRGKETEVKNILRTLLRKGFPPSSNISIWLGTDETEFGFFDLLYSKYVVHTIKSFKYLTIHRNSSIHAFGNHSLMNILLAQVKNHSLYSVQVDYLLSQYAVNKIVYADLLETYISIPP